MTDPIRIITDSTADIPVEIAREYGIETVPIYVRFGDHVYRDGVELTSEQFYEKLRSSEEVPSTSQPSPEDFSRVFSEAAGKYSGAVSIHISSRISGTYNSALLAKNLLASSFPVEVIDSRFNSAGLALCVMAAARSAREGKDIRQIKQDTLKAIREIGMFGMFGTLKYLARSGRVNKAIAMAGNFLNVKPLLTFHEGEVVRAGFVRTVRQGMQRILNYIESKRPVSELMLVHSAVPDQCEELKDRIEEIAEIKNIIVSQLGAALGVHGGPGVLLVAVR
ncbi:MAG: DegV family protein [Dehalococcoidales bacterium]|nr:DegV family protein [Dehalococcoidales bacterium]